MFSIGNTDPSNNQAKLFVTRANKVAVQDYVANGTYRNLSVSLNTGALRRNLLLLSQAGKSPSIPGWAAR